jgi:hypothetical protein
MIDIDREKAGFFSLIRIPAAMSKTQKRWVAWFIRFYSLTPPRAVEVLLNPAKYSRPAC